MKRIAARQKIQQEHLTTQRIYKVMRSLFPKKNDFGNASYEELITELNSYGINTRGQFSALMKRHRKLLLAEDQAYLSAKERVFYRQVYSVEEVAEAVRFRCWYAYPALVRKAAELEFGEIAHVYANET